MENVKLVNVQTVKTGMFRDQLVTLGDLETFKQEIFCEIKLMLKEAIAPAAPRKWLKSYEVRQMLNLSPGTLQTLRSNGTLPYSRMGGAIYYDYEDIQRLLSAGKRNSLQMAVVKKR
jgi:hypothetical protein